MCEDLIGGIYWQVAWTSWCSECLIVVCDFVIVYGDRKIVPTWSKTLVGPKWICTVDRKMWKANEGLEEVLTKPMVDDRPWHHDSFLSRNRFPLWSCLLLLLLMLPSSWIFSLLLTAVALQKVTPSGLLHTLENVLFPACLVLQLLAIVSAIIRISPWQSPLSSWFYNFGRCSIFWNKFLSSREKTRASQLLALSPFRQKPWRWKKDVW